jgi:dTMP kinase
MNSSPPKQGPIFVVLEGIDGSGTTTQLGRLERHLGTLGRRVHATREPSAGPIGRMLRDILLGQHRHPDGGVVDGRTMALLFAADRHDHLAREIEPALAAGMDVISDRYVWSSLAYQALEAERDWVSTLACGIRVPDLTILLDVTIETAFARRAVAGRPVERYDDDVVLKRVAENYRRLAGEQMGACVVDGSGTADEVQARIIAVLAPFFEQKIENDRR